MRDEWENIKMKGKILIVDDEADLRELLKSVLASDYVVTAAENAAALQKCYLHEAPDIVLLDVGLPELNGIETARIVKRRFASTKVYLATLFDEALYEMEAHRVAADGIISKSQFKRSLASLLRVAQHQASQ